MLELCAEMGFALRLEGETLVKGDLPTGREASSIRVDVGVLFAPYLAPVFNWKPKGDIEQLGTLQGSVGPSLSVRRIRKLVPICCALRFRGGFLATRFRFGPW